MIPKQQRHKLGARSHKCLFLGYSNTSRAYQLYDEDNKKLIVSRDVVFLEFDKDAPIIDRQLSHLDKFTSSKFYYELENDFPHHEGGMPTLDHPMDFLSIRTLENRDSLNNIRDSNKRVLKNKN